MAGGVYFVSVVLFVATLIAPCPASDEQRKLYIVYMGSLDEGDQSRTSNHINMLQEVVDIRFAAHLTTEEIEKLANHERVVSIFPSKTYHPQTTRSWDFVGFPETVHRDPTVESDTIIGVIDTGIWPESQSFNDEGFSPPPKKWNGACNGGKNFTCNNKLIGARYYNIQNFPTEISARDTIGHGTHTASTAVGNYVKDVSFYDIAKGTTRGAVPSARIVAYKVCSSHGCNSADILAAFDDAIADGVDIISISLGGDAGERFIYDPTAIGSLHATVKGILVVQSAGNDEFRKTVGSVAPWIFTVAASTIDRGIISRVVLGNGTKLTGRAVNTFKLEGTNFALVYGKNISSTCDEGGARNCQANCLEDSLVKGKIVLCNSFSGITEASRAGALGSIVQSGSLANVSLVVPFPASGLNEHDFSLIKTYINSTEVPQVNILTSEIVTNFDAPRVANFSSRGPSYEIPDILKIPDITAPGVEILAAFSPVAPPSEFSSDKRSVSYNIVSGTSMSCPHVAGAASYVKSLHPDWSPSSIKSALMTTARRMNATEDPNAEFSYGSGHIDPVKATDPGLVYETLTEDYAAMLCEFGYDTPEVRKIFGSMDCSDGGKLPKDVNYPTIFVRVVIADQNKTSTAFKKNFTRTVTNVGSANSTYMVKTSKGSDYNITVNLSILTFGAKNEKKSFEVIVSGKINLSFEELISAELEWFDGIHNVRSSIVIYPVP